MSAPPVSLLLSQARAARGKGDMGDCIAICEQILMQTPRHNPARSLLLQALTLTGQLAPALQRLQGWLDETPGDRDLHLRQLGLLRAAGQLADAQLRLQAALHQWPDDPDLLTEAAQLASAQGDCPAALAACDRVLTDHPTHFGARLLRLDLLIAGGDVCGVAAMAGTAMQSPGAEPRLLARAALALPDRTAADLFAQMPADWSADSLPSGVTWKLCLLAARHGRGDLAQGLLRRLLDRPMLALSETLAMLTILHGAGLAGWATAAQALAGHLPPDLRDEYLCELAALDQGAAAALALRPRIEVAGRTGGARLALLTRLMRQTGRVAVAARWQGLVLRRLPSHPKLVSLHVRTLLQAGRHAVARQLLAAIGSDPRRNDLAWREMVAQTWAEMDQPERACRIAHGLVRQHGRIHLWHARSLIRIGRTTEASALLDRFRAQQSGLRAAHFQGSVDAMLELEARMAPPGATEDRFVAPAIHRLHRARDLGPAPPGAPAPPIPRRIVQYWDSARLPDELAPVTASWARVPGHEYLRFNRESARRTLRQGLDPSYLRAFDNARSATEESDFFRLCHLAVKGGIYADCDDWRTGDVTAFVARSRGLLLLREPQGSTANNFIAAPAGHPALLRAAVMARAALLERANDSPWSKTGPGLMTRAVAWYLEDCTARARTPALTVLPQFMAGTLFDQHLPLGYKRTERYWRARRQPAGLARWLTTELAGRSGGG